MEKKLKFINTMSIPEFKNKFDVNAIELKRNEGTGKYFFVYGVETGAVSRKVENGKLTEPVISEVCSSATGEMFYLMHQKGEGAGAVTLATF